MGVVSEDSLITHTYNMMHLIFAALFASVAALPLEDTADVAAAKAEFKAAFDVAAAGGLIDSQAAQISAEYLADSEDVAAAKAAFQAAFDDAAAGGLAAKQAPAPVHELPVPAALPLAAPNALPFAGYPYGVNAL